MDTAYPDHAPSTRRGALVVVGLGAICLVVGLVAALVTAPAGRAGAPGRAAGTTASRVHDQPDRPVALVVGDSLLLQSATDVRQAIEGAAGTWCSTAGPASGITGGFSIGSWPDRITDLVRIAQPEGRDRRARHERLHRLHHLRRRDRRVMGRCAGSHASTG